jgi:pimeloyl-ACP methyl ester carboxylesterase
VQIDQGARWRHRLGTIAARTLVLHGDSDPLFPPGNAEALAAAIPDARLRLLAGVGHELSPRRWDEYSELIAMLASGTSADR